MNVQGSSPSAKFTEAADTQPSPPCDTNVVRYMDLACRIFDKGVYILTQIAIVLELNEIELRLNRLEKRADGKLQGRREQREKVLGGQEHDSIMVTLVDLSNVPSEAVC